MNKIYVLTETSRAGAEDVSIISEEMYQSMQPLPEGTSAVKFVPHTALKDFVERAEKAEATTVRWENRLNIQMRNMQAERSQTEIQLQKIDKERHDAIDAIEEALREKERAEEEQQRIMREADERIGLLRESVERLQERLIDEKQRAERAEEEQQRIKREADERIALLKELEAVKPKTAWQVTVSGPGCANRVKYYATEDAAVKFKDEFFKAEDIVRGDQPRFNHVYIGEITIQV
jgi:hypothetical protein